MTTTARDSSSAPQATLFAALLTRRQVLQSGVAAAMLAMFGGPGCAATGGARPLGFKSVPLSATDTLVVPDGYRADVLYAWGDPIGHAFGSPAFRFDASNTAEEQALQAGMHHDGRQV
jgi:secreted PhoX family phosphatase